MVHPNFTHLDGWSTKWSTWWSTLKPVENHGFLVPENVGGPLVHGSCARWWSIGPLSYKRTGDQHGERTGKLRIIENVGELQVVHPIWRDLEPELEVLQWSIKSTV